ncbi:MAG: hypothetical protein MHM6MM_009039, partial [Cercozoa sp. M6MM]
MVVPSNSPQGKILEAAQQAATERKIAEVAAQAPTFDVDLGGSPVCEVNVNLPKDIRTRQTEFRDVVKSLQHCATLGELQHVMVESYQQLSSWQLFDSVKLNTKLRKGEKGDQALRVDVDVEVIEKRFVTLGPSLSADSN